METKLYDILRNTVQENNILPITSICNMSCVFCSHRQNPSDIKVYQPGHLDFELIKELVEYLPRSGPVILGESATRIIEGEPFLHPVFEKIIAYLRKKFIHREIRITTSGSLLTSNLISFLENMSPLSLNLSLNCPSPELRAKIMNDSNPEVVFNALPILAESKIRLEGSIVAVPFLPVKKYIKRTLDVMVKGNPATVRIFLPGYTKYSIPKMEYNKGFSLQLFETVNYLSSKYKFPVLIEPPYLKDLTCKVKGVVSQSPADLSGFKKGDIIITIDKKQPLTRVEAFNILQKSSYCKVSVLRYMKTGKEKKVKLELKKPPASKSGIVLDYDFPPRVIKKLDEILSINADKKICVITSILAVKLIKFTVNKFLGYDEVIVLPVKNRYFGGSIGSAGLLIVDDIIYALQKSRKNFDLILLPGIIFDNYGKDLKGMGVSQIKQETGSEIKIIKKE